MSALLAQAAIGAPAGQPPIATGAPPGAPPDEPPFQSALDAEWARTATAEGPQGDDSHEPASTSVSTSSAEALAGEAHTRELREASADAARQSLLEHERERREAAGPHEQAATSTTFDPSPPQPLGNGSNASSAAASSSGIEVSSTVSTAPHAAEHPTAYGPVIASEPRTTAANGTDPGATDAGAAGLIDGADAPSAAEDIAASADAPTARGVLPGAENGAGGPTANATAAPSPGASQAPRTAPASDSAPTPNSTPKTVIAAASAAAAEATAAAGASAFASTSATTPTPVPVAVAVGTTATGIAAATPRQGVAGVAAADSGAQSPESVGPAQPAGPAQSTPDATAASTTGASAAQSDVAAAATRATAGAAHTALGARADGSALSLAARDSDPSASAGASTGAPAASASATATATAGDGHSGAGDSASSNRQAAPSMPPTAAPVAASSASPDADSFLAAASAGGSEPASASTGGPAAAPLSYGVDLQQAIEAVHATIDLAARQGLSQARIALAPEELGEIRIHLTQTAAGLSARVTADSPAAAQALAGGHAELRQSLRSLGLTLTRLDIGHADASATGGGGLQSGAHDSARGQAASRATVGASRAAVTDSEDPDPDAQASAQVQAPSVDEPGALVDVLA